MTSSHCWSAARPANSAAFGSSTNQMAPARMMDIMPLVLICDTWVREGKGSEFGGEAVAVNC